MPQKGFPGGTRGKESSWQYRKHETWVQSLGQEDPLEKGMTTHSSILAWEISWTKEPGRLQSKGLQELNMNEVTFMHARSYIYI